MLKNWILFCNINSFKKGKFDGYMMKYQTFIVIDCFLMRCFLVLGCVRCLVSGYYRSFVFSFV